MDAARAVDFFTFFALFAPEPVDATPAVDDFTFVAFSPEPEDATVLVLAATSFFPPLPSLFTFALVPFLAGEDLVMAVVFFLLTPFLAAGDFLAFLESIAAGVGALALALAFFFAGASDTTSGKASPSPRVDTVPAGDPKGEGNGDDDATTLLSPLSPPSKPKSSSSPSGTIGAAAFCLPPQLLLAWGGALILGLVE